MTDGVVPLERRGPSRDERVLARQRDRRDHHVVGVRLLGDRRAELRERLRRDQIERRHLHGAFVVPASEQTKLAALAHRYGIVGRRAS